jgi:hypothetical protein
MRTTSLKKAFLAFFSLRLLNETSEGAPGNRAPEEEGKKGLREVPVGFDWGNDWGARGFLQGRPIGFR